jgi:hypothetical protein
VILAAIVGMILLSNFAAAPPQNTIPTPTITPVALVTQATPTPVPSPTPAVVIASTPAPQSAVPPTGVWVRVSYLGKFDGTFGTPTSKHIVGERNTGDQFFMVSTITGPVEASIQKLDGSNGELLIEVYKNGELMKRATTIAPKGIIDLQVDLKPQTTPTAVPVVNTTAASP